MQKEVWIDIDEYDGVYQVSNIGKHRVKFVDGKIPHFKRYEGEK
jgi:hypothetical protein